MRISAISLKTRLILSMVLLSLLSIATVGFFAHEQLIRRLDQGINADAERHFSQSVVAYLRTYGSWEASTGKDTFERFVEEHRETLFAHHKDEDSLFHLLGLNELPASTHLSTFPSPFARFYLFDTTFRARMDTPPYRLGDKVSSEMQGDLQPIVQGDKVVAYYISSPPVDLPPIDQAYLAIIRQALLVSGAVAALLALVFGSVISLRLVRRLERLTHAVDAMDQGQLKQFVEHASNDEIGRLAQAFNRMSERLYLADKDIRDSHQQIAEQAKLLKEQSLRDPLTQLYNRRYIDQMGSKRFEQVIQNGQPFCAMIGDIDFFKSINDQFTHAIGDDVLQAVATILQHHQSGGDIVARYGGEEFVMLFPATSLSKATHCCEQIRLAIADHDWGNIHPMLAVTISMGVAAHRQENSLSALIQRADEKLYVAKANGRNQVVSL